MNKSSVDFATVLRRAVEATVVKKPVIRKRPKPVKDAIYGVAEPKKTAQKKVLPKKNLTDAELQRIWTKNQMEMKSQTATALASMQQRSPSPQRLPPVPAMPIGRPQIQPQGILSTAPQTQTNPMWRIK